MSTSLATWLKSLLQQLSTLVEDSQHATVIMGNEACDLDSGVSSLCLAFHRATSQNQNIIPLFNIPCLDFPLKTELVAALAEESIDESSLFFPGQRSIHPQSTELFSCTGRPQRPSRWGQGPGKQSCGNCGPSCQGNKVGASCHHRTNWILCFSGLEDHS